MDPNATLDRIASLLTQSADDAEAGETCDHSGHYVAFHNPLAAHFWKGTDRPFTTPEPISPPKGWASVEA